MCAVDFYIRVSSPSTFVQIALSDLFSWLKKNMGKSLRHLLPSAQGYLFSMQADDQWMAMVKHSGPIY